MKKTVVKTFLDAVTATTTSSAISIKYANKVTFLFTRADHSAGSSTFTISGSIDGTTYVTLTKLVTNIANTNAETKTRSASVALAANGSQVASLDFEHDCYTKI